MGLRPRPVLRPSVSLAVLLSFLATVPAPPASAEPPKTVTAKPATAQPIEITAERIQYIQESETHEAEGSVVIVQGPLRLTADKVTIRMLPGILVAVGRAHLADPTSDLWAERLEMDINTEAGVVTNGKLFLKQTNTLVTGRLLQRFSESHFRVKEGAFTNCDAMEGQVPAWRFIFKDVDLQLEESLYARDVWFCVNDIPLIPLPTLSYPIQTGRKTGLLVPTIGYDNRFGAHYRHGFYWAATPSQDVTVTPDYLSNRGYGGDLEYRYKLDRRSKGQWLLSYIQDTEINRSRAQLIGTHIQQVNPDLSIRAQSNLLTDRQILNNLSYSGVLRALPSQESNLNINQRFATGTLYLLSQYLQPLGVGGSETFQRLPEIGHRLANVSPFGGPFLLSTDTTLVNFYRDEGFNQSRADLMPTFSTDVLHVGHVVGFSPQLRLRETYYTRSAVSRKAAHRETFWAALEGTSRLDRRFRMGEGGSVLHTMEPSVIYEYVPPTDQSDIVIIDDVDDLPKKNLLTYSLRSRLLEHGSGGPIRNWLDLTIAQSYHPGSTPNRARAFVLPDDPLFAATTQPVQPPTTPVETGKFSDIWTRAVIGSPVGALPEADQVSLTLDTFFDPYGGSFSQWNTDLRWQHRNLWYVDLGQRFTREGNRPRRGDIWNPLSFGEVFAPTPELQFVTASGAVRLPLGWTVGAKTYYDVKNGNAPELDMVALYQNPCRCWSLGLFFIQFPDRVQYNFLISLTGLGATESMGSQVLRTLLSPLLKGEKGLPWAPTAVPPRPAP